LIDADAQPCEGVRPEPVDIAGDVARRGVRPRDFGCRFFGCGLVLTEPIEDSGLVSGDWFEGLQDLDTMTLGIGGVAVLVILGVVMALRRSRSDDMEWDDDDEF